MSSSNQSTDPLESTMALYNAVYNNYAYEAVSSSVAFAVGEHWPELNPREVEAVACVIMNRIIDATTAICDQTGSIFPGSVDYLHSILNFYDDEDMKAAVYGYLAIFSVAACERESVLRWRESINATCDAMQAVYIEIAPPGGSHNFARRGFRMQYDPAISESVIRRWLNDRGFVVDRVIVSPDWLGDGEVITAWVC